MPRPSSSLHAVRKPPTKPWRKPSSDPPQVYKVEPRGFLELVQRLTGPTPTRRESGAESNGAWRVIREVAPAASLDLVKMTTNQQMLSLLDGHASMLDYAQSLLSPSLFFAYTSWCSESELLSP